MLTISTRDMLVTNMINEVSRIRALTEEESLVLEHFLRRLADPAANPRRLWTAEEDRMVRKLFRAGLTAEKIADRINRKPWAVRRRITILRKAEKIKSYRRRPSSTPRP